MYESSQAAVANVTGSSPKQALSERLLRSVAVRDVERTVSRSSALVASRASVVAFGASPEKLGLPRLFASCLEGPRFALRRAFGTLLRTARANRFERMAGRFAASGSVASRLSVASGALLRGERAVDVSGVKPRLN
jgi:hypothetical protein